MFNICVLEDNNGVRHNIFLSDVVSGYSAKDVIEVPGCYDDVIQNSNTILKFVKLSGAIGKYQTSLFVLELQGNITDVTDVTSNISSLLLVPDTAINMLIPAELNEKEKQQLLSFINVVKFYESIKQSTRISLPEEVLSELSAELKESMWSSEEVKYLKNSDNQEIFQQSYDSNYGIQLPTLEDIHSGDGDLISALDILRVIAPYRKQEGANVFSYKGIYHTPYYKVDQKIKGMVPSYLSWIDGYPTNDTSEFFTYERHMINNLRTLIMSDVARYSVEIISGLFFDTNVGSILYKMCEQKDKDVIYMLLEDLNEANSDSLNCNLSLDKIDILLNNGWYRPDVINMIKDNLSISNEGIIDLIENRNLNRRIIDCDNIPFSLNIAEDARSVMTNYLLRYNYMSTAMYKFLIDLCKKAYRVNWGHTGATLAIPGFVSKNSIYKVDESISEFMFKASKGQSVDPADYYGLFVMQSNYDDSSEDEVDELVSRLDYYITDDTAYKISIDSLDYTYFSTKGNAAQSQEAAIVEYWRNVNGENNLDNFISGAFLATNDSNVFIECFIRLMRWGENKPRLLVISSHPEIRYVFDLISGLQIDNTAFVDENDLIKCNGCEFSLKGFLVSNSNPEVKNNSIVGFLLQKDYGSVQKSFLASWSDMGCMLESDNIEVGNFLVIDKFNFNVQNTYIIEDFNKQDYQLYASSENISKGIELGIKPKELSDLILLTIPKIMSSVGYIKSLREDTIITTKDRQYDNLHRYIDVLTKFYNTYGNKINSFTNSMELADTIKLFYEMYKNSSENKEESNEVIGNSTLAKLSLGSNNIDWDTRELSGKFFIITDTEMKSSMPAIEFSDANMRKLANQVRNRIVMLLLQQDDCFILCRKEINVSEIAIVTVNDSNGNLKKTVAHKPYSLFDSVINSVKNGSSATINKKKVLLHESLKEFI